MRLADSLIGIFAFVMDFQHTVAVKQPGLEEVRGRLEHLLVEAEAEAKASGVSVEALDHGRFAVCAWADEVFAGACWDQKQAWLKDQLQRRYFNTTDAGEEFFRRLGGLGPQQNEAREVYYLCLVAGFTGMFCKPGDEKQLERLKMENLELLLGSSAGMPPPGLSELFPEAYPPEDAGSVSARPKHRFPLVTLACLAVPPLILVVLFIIYRFTLDAVAESFLRTVASQG